MQCGLTCHKKCLETLAIKCGKSVRYYHLIYWLCESTSIYVACQFRIDFQTQCRNQIQYNSWLVVQFISFFCMLIRSRVIFCSFKFIPQKYHSHGKTLWKAGGQRLIDPFHTHKSVPWKSFMVFFRPLCWDECPMNISSVGPRHYFHPFSSAVLQYYSIQLQDVTYWKYLNISNLKWFNDVVYCGNLMNEFVSSPAIAEKNDNIWRRFPEAFRCDSAAKHSDHNGEMHYWNRSEMLTDKGAFVVDYFWLATDWLAGI